MMPTFTRAIAACVCVSFAAGCSVIAPWTSSSTSVTADQFNVLNAPAEITPRVAVPIQIAEPPKEVVDRTVVAAGPEEEIVASRAETTPTVMPDGSRTVLPLGPEEMAAERPAGQPWPVDGLVGQINGKAIYADEFLSGMSARLAQIGALPDRLAARREIIQMVGMRFEQEVNNRLIISEAESSIPPEAREGLFEFLRTLQEKETAERGGTRSATEASIQEQFGMSVEQFIERRKNEALAGDLIRRRIEPRAIVSWRDIERAYDRAKDEFAPGATIVIGRITLRTQGNEAKIEEVKAQFAAGADFRTVAKALDMPNDGVWFERTLDEKGIEGMEDVRVEHREALKNLAVGQVSEPFTIGPATLWVVILSREQPEVKSLFDPSVQIRLRNELQNHRMMQEQDRYFQALRSRWISDDIDEMRLRLIDIALRRYMQ